MRKPIMLMRKKGLLGPYFGKYANLRSCVAKSVGGFYDVNGAGSCPYKMTVGAQDVRFGYLDSQFGAIDPTTTQAGVFIKSIWVTVAGDFVMSFGNDGNTKPTENDSTIIVFEGFGGLLCEWNETTTQYEATSLALYTYLSGQEGEELCVYSDPDYSNYYFWGADYTSDDYMLKALLVGAEPHSTAHASPMYAPDHEGVMQLYNANDPVWQGARVVLSGGAGTNVIEAYADDGVGALLDPLPMLVSQDEFTNSLLHSSDLTQSIWTHVGSTPPTRDEVGITGQPNTATTITDSNAGGYDDFNQATAIDAATTDITVRVFIKKDSDTSRYPGLHLYYINGTPNSQGNNFNTMTGVSSNETAGIITKVEEYNDWWVLYAQTTNEGLNNTKLFTKIWPAVGNTPDTQDVSAQGSCVIGNFETFLNSTIEDVESIYPIITEASPVTTGVRPTFDAANHSDTDGPIGLIFDYPAEADMDILSLTEGAYLKVEDGGVGNELISSDSADYTPASNSVITPVQNGFTLSAENGTAYANGLYTAERPINVVPDKQYILSFTLSNQSSPAAFQVGTTGADAGAFDISNSFLGNGDHEIIISTSGTVMYFQANSGGTANGAATFTNISVKEAAKVLTLTDQTNSVSLPMPAAPATVEAYALYEQGANDVLNFTGSEYGTLSLPVTFSGDSTIEIEYATTMVEGGTATLMGSTAETLSGIHIYPTSIRVVFDGVKFDEILFSDPALDGIWNDGHKHKITMDLVNNVSIISFDGVPLTNKSVFGLSFIGWDTLAARGDIANYFIGNIYSVTFTDSVISTNNQTYIFDGGETDYVFADEGGLGSELFYDGFTIDNPTDWNLKPSASISDGILTIDTTVTGTQYQDCRLVRDPPTIGAYYRLEATLLSVTNNNTLYYAPGAAGVSSYTFTEPETKSAILACTSGQFMFEDRHSITGVSTFTNPSAKQLNKACLFTDIDASNWIQGDGKMQLKLGSTYSAEVDYTNSFGTGDLVVGATQRSIARWNEKTIEAQQAKTLRVAQLPTL